MEVLDGHHQLDQLVMPLEQLQGVQHLMPELPKLQEDEHELMMQQAMMAAMQGSIPPGGMLVPQLVPQGAELAHGVELSEQSHSLQQHLQQHQLQQLQQEQAEQLQQVDIVVEDGNLATCESFLAGCQTQSQFLKVGAALMSIHDKQLFKPTYASFSEYVQAHPAFGFGPRQAMRLVAATKLVSKFPPHLAKPANERQVRPLVSLDFDQALEIWTKANLIAEETGEPVTHKLIQELLGKQEPSTSAAAGRDWKGQTTTELKVWQTPGDILTRVKCLFQGVIDLDPCSDVASQEVIRAKKYYTAEEDGLNVKNKWSGKVYINAPGGTRGDQPMQGLFLQRSVKEYGDDNISEAVLLVKADIGNPWFSMVYDHPHCFLTERLPFTQPDGKDAIHGHGHAVVYLGSNIDGFCELFSEMGSIAGHNGWSRNSQPTKLARKATA